MTYNANRAHFIRYVRCDKWKQNEMIWSKFRNNVLLFVFYSFVLPQFPIFSQFSVTYVNTGEFRRRSVDHAVPQLAHGTEQLSKKGSVLGRITVPSK